MIRDAKFYAEQQIALSEAMKESGKEGVEVKLFLLGTSLLLGFLEDVSRIRSALEAMAFDDPDHEEKR